MRQSIDMKLKKERRGVGFTVMCRGGVPHHRESWFVSLRSSVLTESLGHASLVKRCWRKVAIVQRFIFCDRSPVFDVYDYIKLPDGRLVNFLLWALNDRRVAFDFGGASNAGRDHSTLGLTTQNPEQRCCAAA